MDQTRLRYVAVEASFLLELANGDQLAEKAVDLLNGIGCHFLYTQTTEQTLATVHQTDPSQPIRDLAKLALSNLTNWCFVYGGLNPRDEDLAHVIAGRMVGDGVLQNVNLFEVRPITEASLNNCWLILTSEEALLLESNTIQLTLEAFGLETVTIASPQAVVEVLESVRKVRATLDPETKHPHETGP